MGTVPQALSDREVQVWYTFTDSGVNPELLQTCERILSPEETERYRRFSFEAGRRQYLLSHGFLRLVLSRYAEVAPQQWQFVRGAYGKPELASVHHDSHWLSFNLTHTNGLTACAVTRSREVGVDAEDTTRRGRDVSPELIRRCLSPGEKLCFDSLHPEQRQVGFFDYWTLKEAYLKARGFGLSLPIEAITFRWPSGIAHMGEVAVEFDSAIPDDPDTWQFERFMPTATHKIAVAVRRMATGSLDVVYREFTSG